MINPLSSLPNYGTRTNEITIYAGPCSVESEEQFNEVAECIAGLGLTWIRGGAFKPRTNPHSFQGLGEEGLQIMKAGAEKYGLKTLTEVMDSAHCEMVHSYVDGLQIGARNMQNFSLLKNVGKVTAQSHKMVLLKRGLAGSISEWLSATTTSCCPSAACAPSKPLRASRLIFLLFRLFTSSRYFLFAWMFRIPLEYATWCLLWHMPPSPLVATAS